MEREYKKEYWGFVLWVVGFIVALFGITFLIDSMHCNEKIETIVSCNVLTFAVFILAFVIYKTEKIYWYTGISFEQARDAGSKRRIKYAASHMKRFGLLAVFFAIFSVIAYFTQLSVLTVTYVATIWVVGVAISTMWIKL